MDEFVATNDSFALGPEPAGAPSALDRPANRWLRGDRARFIAMVVVADEVQQESYELRLMPEQYSLDRPSRSTVTQTRGGYFIDQFDLGIGTLTMSGTTGWGQMPNNAPGSIRSAERGMVDGLDRWVGLVRFFRTFFEAKQADRENRLQLHFYNFLEQEAFIVWPLGLPQLSRSVREPLLFRYQLQFAVLKTLKTATYAIQDPTPDDPLGQIAIQTDRAARIAARMDEQLRLQAYLAVWIKTGVDLSRFDPLTFDPGSLAALRDDEQDAITQSFVDQIVKAQAAPDFVVPTDSSGGTVFRTRTLIDNVNDYTRGVTETVRSTLGEVQAVANGWRDLLDATDYALGLPVVYAREVRETLCSVQSLLLYPQLFRSTVSASLKALTDLALDSGCATTLRL